MLYRNQRGYATMNRELTAFSLEDESLDTCKKYCRDDCVVVERIPYVNGFSIRVIMQRRRWGKFIRYDKYTGCLYIWRFQFQLLKEYSHKIGKIVYDPKAK